MYPYRRSSNHIPSADSISGTQSARTYPPALPCRQKSFRTTIRWLLVSTSTPAPTNLPIPLHSVLPWSAVIYTQSLLPADVQSASRACLHRKHRNIVIHSEPSLWLRVYHIVYVVDNDRTTADRVAEIRIVSARIVDLTISISKRFGALSEFRFFFALNPWCDQLTRKLV